MMSQELCNHGITAMMCGDFEDAAALFLLAVKAIKCKVDTESSNDDGAAEIDATAQIQSAKVKQSVLQQDCKSQDVGSPPDTKGGLLFPIQISMPLEKQLLSEFQSTLSDYAADHCKTTRARSDEVDRIYTCAIASSSSCVTAPFLNDDEMLFDISIASAALLYNAALSFQFLWIERGRSSILRRALKYYQAARSILRTAFPIEELFERRFKDKNEIIAFMNQFCPCKHVENAIFVWLAILNNMNAIYFELVQREEVDKVREEMRKLFLIFDPLVSFGPHFDESAYSIIYMNAFFYQDNKDMVIARAA